jgi:hypothetical protein
VKYCRNLIFRRNFPIHQLFERSCDLGLLRLSADRISQVFGWRLHRRLRGKLSSVLEQIAHGHHVLRAYAKNAVVRMYEKFSTFLRLEVAALVREGALMLKVVQVSRKNFVVVESRYRAWLASRS